jgi:hypothetical protein
VQISGVTPSLEVVVEVVLLSRALAYVLDVPICVNLADQR